MARSIKKGPFADASLLKEDRRNERMQEKNLLLKHGLAVLQSSQAWLDIQLPFMTEENMYLYM